MSEIITDLQVARRSLRRVDAAWVTAMLTIAAGIAVFASGFALVRNLLLVPLPVHNPEAVVVAWPFDPTTPSGRGALSLADLHVIQNRTRALENLAPVHQVGARGTSAHIGGRPATVDIALVGGSFFQVLGVVPQVGRLLVADDDQSRDGNVLVLSDSYWRREFSADPAIVGSQIDVSGTSYTIVGVAPRRFEYPQGAQAWIPMLAARPELREDPEAGWATLVGRIHPGVSIPQVAADLEAALYPESRSAQEPGPVVAVQPFSEVILGGYRSTSILLASGGLLVLLVAAANVSGLVMSRSLSRLHELAVRAALGATRRRLFRELVVAHAVLGVAGGTLGVLLATFLLKLVRLSAPATIAQSIPATVDPAIVGLGLLGIGIALPVFAVWPAFVATRPAVEHLLRAGRRALAGGRDRLRREALISIQFALAVVVAATAILLIRSLDRLQRQDLGYQPGELLFVGVQPLGPHSFTGWDQYGLALGSVREALNDDPRLAGVTVSMSLPVSGGGLQLPYWLEGEDMLPSADVSLADAELGDAGHFETMGIPISRGRGFTSADAAGGAPVIIVSESFARQAWPNADVLGRRIRVRRNSAEWRTVVGVVADSRYRDFLAPRPTVYLPAAQMPQLVPGYFVVRPVDPPAEARLRVRGLVQDADSRLGIRIIRTGDELLAEPLARPRFLAWTLSGLGTAATILAFGGLVGMMLNDIRQRRSELAIRIAVGASPARIRSMMLYRSALIAGTGLTVGMAMAVATAHLFRSTLYGISPADPFSYAASGALLLSIALVAGWLAARRAASVDPMLALKAD